MSEPATTSQSQPRGGELPTVTRKKLGRSESAALHGPGHADLVKNPAENGRNDAEMPVSLSTADAEQSCGPGFSASTESLEDMIRRVIREELALTNTPARDRSRYWLLDEARQYVQVCERTFKEWMADGRVRVFKVGGVVRFHPAQLDEDLAKYCTRRRPKHRKGK